MILEHKTYDLFGKVLFEKAIIIPPFRRPTIMSNDACFLHIIEGENNTFTTTDQIKIRTKESVLIKCGNYMSQMIGTNTNR